MRGGKREGSGRPLATKPTKAFSVRLNAQQHAVYMRLGGARWLKRTLDAVHEQDGAEKISKGPSAPANQYVEVASP